jgi:hypothetical protein
MTKTLSFVSSLILATLLVWPSAADAQASRRGGSDSGGSSGGSSSGSRGGSDSGGSVAMPRHSPPPPPARSEPSDSQPTASRGRVSRGSSSDAPVSRVESGERSDGVGSASRRLRTNQAPRGTAQPRGDRPLPGEDGIDWYPWYYTPGYYYSSYPRYHYGYDPFYGPFAYSPWLYGAWSWNAYGWNTPFLYDPYYWYGGGAASSSYRDDADEAVATGSIRLRVNPGAARVYVDGALAGEASEFGGFSDHLALPEGRHQIELRADGYEPRTIDVTVKAGRTQTERVNLKKTD